MIIQTNVSNIGDPQIVLYEGKYYMYATTPAATDGFRVWTADKLTDEWVDLGICYTKDTSWGYCDFWAPEVLIHNGKFYMVYSARQRTTGLLKIGMAISDKPTGPFVDVTQGEPFYDPAPEVAVIDAHILVDGDANYMYYSKDCSVNVVNGVHTSQIWVVRLSDDLTEIVGEPVLCTTPDDKWETEHDDKWQWNEGPSVSKVDGKYVLTYSANCFASKEYSVGAAESDSPLGPWKKYGYPILSYIEGEISGPGHNSFFTAKDGSLMTAFHIHTDYDHPSENRRACFAPVRIEQGKIVIDYKE